MRQRELDFEQLYQSAREERREAERRERVARILDSDKRITTAAKLFDPAEAERIAAADNERVDVKNPWVLPQEISAVHQRKSQNQ
jgi:hypothetical protein